MAKWTVKQEQRLNMLSSACSLQENFSDLKSATIEATLNFTYEMGKATVNLANQKVGVKTGKTKNSIRVKKGKYTNSSVLADTWLINWLANGGGKYRNNKKNTGSLDKSLKGRAYRKAFHTHAKRKKISESKMLKSHPAYYLLRPAKQLMGSYKATTTYEKCMKLQEKKWSIENA